MMTASNGTTFQHISAPPQFFFVGQAFHFLLVILLLAGAWALVDFDHLANRYLFGLDGRVWFFVALFVPVFHQMYVWLACYAVNPFQSSSF